MQPDAVLGVGVIEDGNAVAIGDFDDLAGEGVGEGRAREIYEEAKSDWGRWIAFFLNAAIHEAG